MPKRHYRIHSRGTYGRQEAGDNANHGKDEEGCQHDAARCAEDYVPFVVGGLVHLRIERHGRNKVRNDDRDEHAGNACDEGEREGFEQELLENVATPSSECFLEADFAGSLRNRHKHDVHHAYAANGQRHRPNNQRR